MTNKEKNNLYLEYITNISKFIEISQPEFNIFSNFLDKFKNKVKYAVYENDLTKLDKELIDYLENDIHSPVFGKYIKKIKEDSQEMIVARELLALSTISNLLYSPFISYPKVNFQNKNEITLPLKTDQFYSPNNRKESIKLLKQMENKFPTFEKGKDWDELYDNIELNFQVEKEKLVNNTEYYSLFLLKSILNNETKPSPNSISVNDLNYNIEKFSLPVFNYMKKNDVDIPFSISDTFIADVYLDEFNNLEYGVNSLKIDIQESVNKLRDIPNLLNNCKFDLQTNLIDIKFQKIEIKEAIKHGKFKILKGDTDIYSEEQDELAIKASLKKEKQQEEPLISRKDEIDKLLFILNHNKLIDKSNIQNNSYVLVKKEYQDKEYPVWMQVSELNEDVFCTPLIDENNELMVFNKNTNKNELLGKVFSEMYPFGLNVKNEDILLLTNNKPLMFSELFYDLKTKFLEQSINIDKLKENTSNTKNSFNKLN
jgi:hypothetical protein